MKEYGITIKMSAYLKNKYEKYIYVEPGPKIA
jgi:hypothetical protein